MADLVARIDGRPSSYISNGCAELTLFSTSIGTLGIAKRGIHAVCVPLDELFIDAGDQRPQHNSHVGYVSSQYYLTSVYVPY